MTYWSDYDNFIEDVFGTPYMIWHDGLNINAISGIPSEKKEEALSWIKFGIENNDAVAAEAASQLYNPEIVSLLEEKYLVANGDFLVKTALTLKTIKNDDSYAKRLLEVHNLNNFWGIALNFTIALRHFNYPGIDNFLLKVIEQHPDYLVTYHACESLLSLHHIRPSCIGDHPEIFPKILEKKEEESDDAFKKRKMEACVLMKQLIQYTP